MEVCPLGGAGALLGDGDMGKEYIFLFFGRGGRKKKTERVAKQ